MRNEMKTLGDLGAFAVDWIAEDLRDAKDALRSGNAEAMQRAIDTLRRHR